MVRMTETATRRPENPFFLQYVEKARRDRFEWFLGGNVPDAMLREIARAVVAAGDQIKMLDPVFKVKEGEGHRSGVTKGDEISQGTLLERLSASFPEAKFLSEEGKGEHPNLLDVKSPNGILDAPLAFIMDPLDGTAPYSNKLGTWCIAVGVMARGQIVGSVVYAPAVQGGMLVVADRDGNVRIAEWDFTKIEAAPRLTTCTKPQKCFVAMGVDPTLYPTFTRLLDGIGANIKAWGLTNSGILGITQAACGRIQAVIQTPQKVWDWAPAYAAVIATGRIIRFFRLVPDPTHQTAPPTDILAPVELYDFAAFCSMPKSNRLGFVAGEPDIVNRIWNLLPRRGWARTNPDTASGTWT
jgi:fructose-1,6-bisphosphatase/inositol monophosphatase family enzyme